MQYHPHHHAAAPSTACPPHHVVAVPVMHMSPNGQVVAYHHPHHMPPHAPSIGGFTVVQASSAPPAVTRQGQVYPQETKAAVALTAPPGAPDAEEEKEHRFFQADTKTTMNTAGVSDDTHEIAKSVLLLARGGHDKATPSIGGVDATEPKANQQDFSSPKRRDSPTSVDSTDSSSVPLKKRKMVKTTTADNDASVRVSPVSHSSRSTTRALSPENTHATSVMDASHKDNNLTPERNGLPSQVVVVHLPTELYRLLEDQQQQTESSCSQGAVIQWLPHGRAWRIVRWDALRREILPRACFGGSTSIDAFLVQLADWGFTEITDGPDAGAYYNAFFRRGFPHLCKDMQYKPRHTTSPVKSPATSATHSPALKHETTPRTHVSTHSASSTRTPSILQVPSLASPHDAATNGSSPSSPPTAKRTMATTGTPPRSSPQPFGTYVSAARPNMPFWLVDANQQAVLVQYRPSTTMPEEQVATHSPTYSPPVRVHSTRGRLSGAPVAHRPPIVTPVRRVEETCASSMVSVGSYKKLGGNFPISRRGRARSLARPISHSSASSAATAASVIHSPSTTTSTTTKAA